jgi:thiol-disulfide isomerase/thioredoxin
MYKKWNHRIWAVGLIGIFLIACGLPVQGQSPEPGVDPGSSANPAVQTQLPVYDPGKIYISPTPEPGLPTAPRRPTSTQQPAISKEPYSGVAIPQTDIKTALAAAKQDGKLVLLDFGANWCPDCLVLNKLFEDPAVHPYLQDHFRVVRIDVGVFDRNLDTAKKYGNPIEKGIPAVVILTSNETMIATTKDGALANARSATAQDILGYLKMWVSKKP